MTACASTPTGCSTTWKNESPRTRPPTSTLRSRISLRCCRHLSRVRASPLPWRRRLRILPQTDVPCARLVLRERVATAFLRRLLVLEALVVPRKADCELGERDVESQSATAAVGRRNPDAADVAPIAVALVAVGANVLVEDELREILLGPLPK